MNCHLPADSFPWQDEAGNWLLPSVCDDLRNRGFGVFALPGFPTLLHQLGDHASPSRLVTGSDSCSRVAVEVLVKQDQIPPVWVGLEFFQIPEYRSMAFLVLEEDIRHAARQFSRHLP